MLLTTFEDTIFQKGFSKKYMFVFLDFNGFKIVFTLLTKIIIFYIQVIIVKIRVIKLKWPISFVFKPCKSLVLSLFNISFYKLYKKYVEKS